MIEDFTNMSDPITSEGWDDFLDSMPGSHPHEFQGEHICNVIGCDRDFSHPIHRT